jgi:hypothetical protein
MTMMTHLGPKSSEKFHCKICDYSTCKKSQYERHLLTRKHKNNDNNDTNDDALGPKSSKQFLCECGKTYNFRQGLHTHRKTCKLIYNLYEDKKSNENNITTLTNLVMDVVKQNQELTNKIVDICTNSQINSLINGQTNSQINNISQNNYNSNNKTFNLQFFLNETCKDAMNISDFIDSLQLQLSDLENVGKIGYVEGISNIIVKSLNALDETERPIHCTDKKRETFYIKDENKWEKEDAEKNKIKKVIKKVACKNQRLLMKYKEEHPGCNYSESKFSEQYSKLVIEAMGGAGSNDAEKEEKIIKKIAKGVTIDKNFD